MARRQAKVRGGRERVGASVHRRIKAAVVQSARRFNVSQSWVQDTILAQYFGIAYEELTPFFADERKVKLRRVR